MSSKEQADTKCRLDKWLWAARFFKTRALAVEAVDGGKVHLNGHRAKPSKVVNTGDQLEIRRGQELFEISVVALSAKRGPASVAQQLYQESPASRERREAAAEDRRLLATSQPAPARRPDKKGRRLIHRFIRKGE